MSRELPNRPLIRRLIVFTVNVRQTCRRACQSVREWGTLLQHYRWEKPVCL